MSIEGEEESILSEIIDSDNDDDISLSNEGDYHPDIIEYKDFSEKKNKGGS